MTQPSTGASSGSGARSTSAGASGAAGCDGGTECLMPCHRWDSSDCGADEFCDFLSRDCGSASIGRCLKRPEPTVCPPECNPICGCDGKSYCTECHAHLSGYDGNPAITCGS